MIDQGGAAGAKFDDLGGAAWRQLDQPAAGIARIRGSFDETERPKFSDRGALALVANVSSTRDIGDRHRALANEKPHRLDVRGRQGVGFRTPDAHELADGRTKLLTQIVV